MLDEQGMVCCDTCGEPLAVGDYPFCPHGRGATRINRDEIPGGVLCENYGPEPIRFYSHGERRRYMKEHHLQEREKFAPLPGTDIDPQGIPNPKGYVDSYTLENGRILIERQQMGKATPEFDGSTVLTDLQVGSITERDVIAVTTGDAKRSSRLHRRMTRE